MSAEKPRDQADELRKMVERSKDCDRVIACLLYTSDAADDSLV